MPNIYFASGKNGPKIFLGLPLYHYTPCARKYTVVKRDWLVERRIKALISGMSQSKRDGCHLCYQLALHLAGPGFHTLVTTKFGQTSLTCFCNGRMGLKIKKNYILFLPLGVVNLIDYIYKIYAWSNISGSLSAWRYRSRTLVK